MIVRVGSIEIGADRPLVLIAGPCVIESEKHTLMMAESIKEIVRPMGIPVIFKASYDKANRTAVDSVRGPGLRKGLAILQEVKRRTDLPILSDVHETGQVDAAAEVLDVIQIPAFLCRQTDLLLAAGRTGRVVNIKKGQFLPPRDVIHGARKVESTGCSRILLTERGFSFGYGDLVVDMRSLAIMAKFGYPVVFDATHAVQQPGAAGAATGGCREFVPVLARAAVAVGISALFLEVHDAPETAPSDTATMLSLYDLDDLLRCVRDLDRAVKQEPEESR